MVQVNSGIFCASGWECKTCGRRIPTIQLLLADTLPTLRVGIQGGVQTIPPMGATPKHLQALTHSQQSKANREKEEGKKAMESGCDGHKYTGNLLFDLVKETGGGI